MNSVLDQMDPDPSLLGMSYGPAVGPAGGQGHGVGIMGDGPRRGLQVWVKLLKKNGVSLSRHERARAVVIVGDLKISRVHDRDLEHQCVAEILRFDLTPGSHNRYFPSREAALINPVIFSADNRGMLIYGIERSARDAEGKTTAYWQTWHVLFSAPEPEPPATS